MENEETTDDIQVELQEDGTVEVEETPTEETPEESNEAKLAKAEAEANKYRRLFEKSQKPKVETSKAPQPASPQNVEETVLLAQGLSEELIGELKIVSQLRKVSLIKAQTDPIFVAIKEKFEKDKKREDASLPASRGSSSIKPKKDFSTPGLTREEHRKMVESL